MRHETTVNQYSVSIFKNTLLPRKVFVLIDGVINLAFKKKIFFYKEKFNFQVLQSKKKIGLAAASGTECTTISAGVIGGSYFRPYILYV